ncbi:ATP-binding protein [Microbispora sp. NPDC049125]|uniref:ATP-binding protein n=1 Tax=Microbispora sp. NPDC049125 TaxID=3154929 RepID=UPI0034657ECB
MSEKPEPTGQLTREVGFSWFRRQAGVTGTTTCALRPQPDSVKTARDVTRSTLRQWGLPELADDATLVVSELVTNAVRYSLYPAVRDLPITLMLLRVAPHVVLAVSDPSDRVPVPVQPDFVSEHGRGLYIVETYSQAWGWDPLDEGGKAVWALFRTGA